MTGPFVWLAPDPVRASPPASDSRLGRKLRITHWPLKAASGHATNTAPMLTDDLQTLSALELASLREAMRRDLALAMNRRDMQAAGHIVTDLRAMTNAILARGH